MFNTDFHLETPSHCNPLLSAAVDIPLHLRIKAIHTTGDSFWADIFPRGEDFSVASDAPSYTNLPAMDTGDTKTAS